MDSCPKCKGNQGYQYMLTIEHTMTAFGWDDNDPEYTNIARTSRGLAECIDCGAKFRLSTIERGNEK